jgi:uncharacterized membrane protein
MYCFEGAGLCANKHPMLKAAIIVPAHTIREKNIPTLYLFRGDLLIVHRLFPETHVPRSLQNESGEMKDGSQKRSRHT